MEILWQQCWNISFGNPLVVGNSVTFHSKMKSTLTCLQKPLSVACFCYDDGDDDYHSLKSDQPQECLGIVQVITIMSSKPFEVISCVTSWYHDPFTEQISSSIIGERMTSSLNIVVIHSVKEWGHRWSVNTTKPQVTHWLFSVLPHEICWCFISFWRNLTSMNPSWNIDSLIWFKM